MNRANSLYLAIAIGLVTIVSLIADIVVIVVTHSFSDNVLLGINIGLLIALIIGGIFVIVETVQGKRGTYDGNKNETSAQEHP